MGGLDHAQLGFTIVLSQYTSLVYSVCSSDKITHSTDILAVRDYCSMGRGRL